MISDGGPNEGVFIERQWDESVAEKGEERSGGGGGIEGENL